MSLFQWHNYLPITSALSLLAIALLISKVFSSSFFLGTSASGCGALVSTERATRADFGLLGVFCSYVLSCFSLSCDKETINYKSRLTEVSILLLYVTKELFSQVTMRKKVSMNLADIQENKSR